jgi:hypothetical protein
MPPRLSLSWLPVLLLLQDAPAPLYPVEMYLHGDADAAVELAARLRYPWPSRPPEPRRDPGSPGAAVVPSPHQVPSLMSWFAGAMLLTESAMHLGVFGRYAPYAPLTPAPVSFGLTGRFDVRSYQAYVTIESLTVQARPSSDALLLSAVREWYGLTISYCLRWKLDCADALAAAAERDFRSSPDVLLVVGSVAEARRMWTVAAARFREALERAPKLVEARLRLGIVELRRGRTADATRHLSEALEAARTQGDRFSQHFALLALADLDAAARRTTRARQRRAEAAALNLVESRPHLAGLDPGAVYAAGQFDRHDARIASLRRWLREWASNAGGGIRPVARTLPE